MTTNGPLSLSCGQRQEDWQATKCTLKERFNALLHLSQWTDCIFAVGEDNTEIKCHKLVLAVSSPVFEALFFGYLADPCNKPIKVPDIEPQTFRMLLMYMYADSLNLHSIEEAGALLYAAKKYLMPQLASLCLEYLLDRTCIQTLWEVLPIAEGLHEEKLIEAVLKIMCRFGHRIWYSKTEYLSPSMLKRISNETNMNMPEEELWSLVLDWAYNDCKERKLSLSGKNIREALQREHLLENIRFLIFNEEKFKNEVVQREILTENEIDIITRMINANEQSQDQKNWYEVDLLNQNTEIPIGLCAINKKRRRVDNIIWRCTREKVKGETMWINSEQFVCNVISHNLVLVTGFEVPTRTIYSAKDCYPYNVHSSVGSYNERFSVHITDQNGSILVSTSYNARVSYDSIQIITLDEEIWFKANTSYFITVEVPSGSYELFNLSRSVQSKGTIFNFKDISAEIFQGSFVTSILYCV